MAKAGRPTLFNQELADRICTGLVEGSSVRAMSKEDWCPTVSTIMKWLVELPSFSEQYRIAREMQAESEFERLFEIADDDGTQTVMTPDGAVEVKFDATAVARNRLRVDTRKWALARMAPKKYGDKIQQELTGADGGPVNMSLKVSFVKPQND